MNETLKKFLIDLGIGLVLSLAMCLMLGAFSAETSQDTVRILSDGFFAVAAGYLAIGGITFTVNGGVMDGLGFAFKTGIARVKRDFEENKMTFAQYRADRESKAKSPAGMLLAGLVILTIALIFLVVYNNM